MPVIRVEYDKSVVSEEQARALCKEAQAAVIEVTGIDETFVYANASHITVDIAPFEVWVEVSEHKVPDPEKAAADMRAHIEAWKKDQKFPHLINLTLVPMHWKLELDI